MKCTSNAIFLNANAIDSYVIASLKWWVACVLVFASFQLMAQDEGETETKPKPVRAMFESSWLIDNQSVVVPVQGTFQMDILHRFGAIGNGYDDFWGFYAPANIKLGFGYTPIDNLTLGFGITKDNMTWDFNAKYAFLQQTRTGSIPLSITYFGNFAIDTRKKDNFINGTDRLSYFHQLIFARKFSRKFSLQIAPSFSHYNAVLGVRNDNQEIEPTLENDHIAIAIGGRYKVGGSLSIIANYDQPITDHPINDPNPNLSFGIELSTSSHAFQIFFGNYYNIVPQRNNVYNNNDPFPEGDDNGIGDNYLIGFNITRLWNW